MKSLLKGLIYLAMLFFVPVALNAQTSPSTGSKQKKPAAPVSNKQISITLKNGAEKNVSVFIGQKTGLRDPKPGLKMLGGLSKNNVYVKVSDVICIMDAKNKPAACIDIKTETTSVEINSSANGISGK